MRLYAASELHPDPWSTVALAFLCRYPNRHAGHILSVDVLQREVTEGGTVRTTRLILKSGKIPMWAMALVGGSGVGAWVLEESEVNPFGPSRYLKSTTRNINHGHLLSVHETTVLRPTAANAAVLSALTPSSVGGAEPSSSSSLSSPATASLASAAWPSAQSTASGSSLGASSSSWWPSAWSSSSSRSAPLPSSAPTSEPSLTALPLASSATLHPSHPMTTHETTGVITTELKVGLLLREKVEAFGESRFARGIERSRLGLREVVEAVKGRREERLRRAKEKVGEASGVGLVGVG